MEENKENNYRLYILMRTDLPSMNAGKAMAQAAHAANLLVFQYGDSRPEVKNWVNEGSGFGTTIVLGVTKEELFELTTDLGNLADGRDAGCVLTGVVIDPTYPYNVNSEIFRLLPTSLHTAAAVWNEDLTRVTAFRKEYTCGFVFCSEADAEYLKHLELHP